MNKNHTLKIRYSDIVNDANVQKVIEHSLSKTNFQKNIGKILMLIINDQREYINAAKVSKTINIDYRTAKRHIDLLKKHDFLIESMPNIFRINHTKIDQIKFVLLFLVVAYRGSIAKRKKNQGVEDYANTFEDSAA